MILALSNLLRLLRRQAKTIRRQSYDVTSPSVLVSTVPGTSDVLDATLHNDVLVSKDRLSRLIFPGQTGEIEEALFTGRFEVLDLTIG